MASGSYRFNTLSRALKAVSAEIEMCGSRVTCNPAPTDTDEDYLVYIPIEHAEKGHQIIELAGWELEGDDTYGTKMANEFNSYRFGDINLIVTHKYDFAEKHRQATAICKERNLLNKADRIAVFQEILYGKVASLLLPKFDAETN